MKKFLQNSYSLLLLSIFITISTSTFAQDQLEVRESMEDMSQGKQNGFIVNIPKSSIKNGEKLWKKFVSSETKTKTKKHYNELVLSGAVLKSMGSDTMNVYVMFLEVEGNSRMQAFFSGMDSVFITSANNEALSTSAKLLVRNFAVHAYQSGVNREMSSEKKVLKKLESDLKGLEKNINSAQSMIKKNEREISKHKTEISSQKKQEEFTGEEITKQKQILTAYVGSLEARKVEDKRLNTLEKSKRNLTRSIENAEKRIDKLEKQNKSSEKSIDEHKKKLIPAKEDEIIKQRDAISKLESVLGNIR